MFFPPRWWTIRRYAAIRPTTSLGVKGASGPKLAAKLLNEYGSLDAIYADLDNIKGATKKKLEAGKEAADHSKFMAKIVT